NDDKVLKWTKTDSNYNEDKTDLDLDEIDYNNCNIDPNIELLEKQILVQRKRKHSSQARKIHREQTLKEINELEEKCQSLNVEASFQKFNELPISPPTLEGLQQANFIEMTEIQQKAIPLALKGKDILGAAKTGSDGLGALVIAPTRELAVQIFEVLRKIGNRHFLSAGLIIGGKDVQIEQERINRMNILICTPGRLLQHMDQTAYFECSNLQILVLDEADRILDMGFQKTINAIIENLPKKRQTLLFSATQTNSVDDLARLSLQNPKYVAVHENSEHSTPQDLYQHYLVCDLTEKLDILFSFIKSHLQVKAVVFLSSCKQARVPLLHLHGKQKQTKRVEIFNKFSAMKTAYLFATDIAARGLDIPAVDWVIQVDAPESADTYIHRVGRTARYDASGHGLLFLLPSEEQGMKEVLKKKKVPIEQIQVKSNRMTSIQKQLQFLCFKDSEIKYLGQKAFISYMRSVYLQSDKSIFKVGELPAEKFAASLGLPGTPKIKFIKKSQAKNAIRQKPREFEEDEGGSSSSDEEKDDDNNNRNIDHEDDKDYENLSKRKLKVAKSKKLSIKNAPKGEKLVFDEDGNPHRIYELRDEKEFHAAGPLIVQKQKFLSKELEMMALEDQMDKVTAKEKKIEMKLKKKAKLSLLGYCEIFKSLIKTIKAIDGGV
ncbi:5071_t:CDS:10, partial [Entrophospora sp. SA101]